MGRIVNMYGDHCIVRNRSGSSSDRFWLGRKLFARVTNGTYWLVVVAGTDWFLSGWSCCNRQWIFSCAISWEELGAQPSTRKRWWGAVLASVVNGSCCIWWKSIRWKTGRWLWAEVMAVRLETSSLSSKVPSKRDSLLKVSVAIHCDKSWTCFLRVLLIRNSSQSSLKAALAAISASSNPCCNRATESNSGCLQVTYSSSSRLQQEVEASAASGTTGGGGILQGSRRLVCQHTSSFRDGVGCKHMTVECLMKQV